MRLVHTADWQFGMAARQAGAAGARVREARLEAAHKVVELANSEHADCLLLAGDTFEHNGVDRALVRQIAEILGLFEGPVCVIPGNHDYLAPGSVWDDPCWSGSPNIHILRSREPFPIPGGTLYPCPLFRSRADEDPTAWIPRESAPGLRIGLAHGTLGELGEDAGYPIGWDAAEQAGLDYLALGHWHSVLCTGRLAYSGTHEPTAFGEKNSGNALVVDVEPGGAPDIRPVRTGTLHWVQINHENGIPGQLPGLVRRLLDMAEPERTLVQLKLRGLLFAGERPELERIRQLLSAFLYSSLDDAGLHPAPADGQWTAVLPDGIVRETAVRLQALAAEDTEQGRIAAQALLNLYALAMEVGA